MDGRARVEGLALHAGVPSAVTFVARPGPLALRRGAVEVAVADLSIARTDRGVAVTGPGGLALDLVEHVLAAAAGLGVREGLVIDVDGPEPPLADGGALAFAEAITSLGLAASTPGLAVARVATFTLGEASYAFAPGAGTRLEVEAVFAHPSLGRQRASWDGSPEAFIRDVAPARTFGFARDEDALALAGRALGAARLARDALVVLTETGVHPASTPPGADEAARHKLLDLVGDLALHGGPPRGSVVATRPGHAATHAVLARARSEGVLAWTR